MDLLIFLAGIVVLTGLGMFLAWPREAELAPDRRRGESVRTSRRRGQQV